MKKIYLQSTILLFLIFAESTKAQTITTIAGTGIAGYNGDNKAASIAQLNQPSDVKIDASGNMLISDFINNRIRKVGTDGFISTIAGTGSPTYNGDNILGTSASLYQPESLALDASGNIFIEDTYNYRIRKLLTNGLISTVAGNGIGAYNGDNIPATNASLYYPSDGVLVDASGNIFISDSYNNRIRKVDINGIITTIAGTGVQGYNGDNIPATNAMIYYPYALALDGAGNLFFADGRNHRIRKIGTTGIITTVAGTGTAGYNGDNILATAASLNTPQGIAFDAAGNLYISDSYNNRIRKINKNTGIITTVVGTGIAGYNGDNIAATIAQINVSAGISFDATGNLFIADLGNHRIRKINNVGIILPLNLIKFTAQLQNGLGLLQWQTNNEINTQNFVIESSNDGVSFTGLGTVTANNSLGINSYSFTDSKITGNIIYYRLKMVDKDGKFTYSSTVTVKLDRSNILLGLYPNPVHNLMNLAFTFNSSATGKYTIQIADVSGKVIQQLNENATAGTNKLTLDLHDYARGTYILTFIDIDRMKSVIKFIKD